VLRSGRRAVSFARLGAGLAFLAVLLGAFGAHVLRDRLGAALSQVYETGVRYQMYHALALVAVGLMRTRASASAEAGAASGAGPSRALDVAGILFFAGTILFSGSLYALALTGARAWGAVTPIGGAAFLVGWVAFALACRGK